MSLPADFSLDARLVRRRFARAAQAGGEDFLCRELARRMDERLAYVKYEPRRILDVGCGGGADFPLLASRYPQAERIGVDFVLPALRRAKEERGFFQRLLGPRRNDPQLIVADAQALPMARASVQMVWSNLLLNWLHDPMPALREMSRVLEVGGLVMFASLGPDTLKELRACLPAGAGERVHRFVDMHDLGDCLVKAGFADPVMDMEILTLTYPSFDALIEELRRSGSTNASTARPRGLAGKAGWARARAAYERLRQAERLPVTVEVIYGHAWKAAPKTTEDGRAVIHFDRGPRGERP